MKRSQINSLPRYYYQDNISISGPDLIEIFREILKKDKIVRFRVSGSSMFPSIRTDDIVSLSPLGERPLQLGEVAAFVHHPGNRLLVHRVVRRGDQVFEMKGDNNRTGDDGTVPIGNILGRMTGLERKGKKVSLGLGPERVFIAWMSRFGLLRLLKQTAKPFYRFFFKRKT